MTVQVHVGSRRLVDGCWGGLAQPTALVEVTFSGEVAVDVATEARLRAGALALCPEEPLSGIAESDWPAGFLLGSAADGDAGRAAAWLVALTVAIQRWGRDPVWHGRVLAADPHGARVAIPWYRPQFFDEALDEAVRLLGDWTARPLPPVVARWLGGETAGVPRTLRQRFGERWQSIQSNGISPYSLRFIQAGVAHDMPFDVLPNYVQIGWGADAQRFDMSFTKDTGWMASALAKNKVKCNRTLGLEGLPVPRAVVVRDADQARQAAEEIGWPVVVKPLNQDQGLGVTARIQDFATLRGAVEAANRLSPGTVVVEKHIDGDDFRLLVVHGQTLQVVKRTPGGVIGDGMHTIRELVDIVNSHPWRGTNQFSRLKFLALDDTALGCLEQQGLDPDAVPQTGRFVWLRRIANVSSGGTAEDMTAVTHPDNRALAERAARIVGLDIAGIDLLISDITRSWRDVGAAICEVNAQPGFRVHWLANPDRDLEAETLEMLFAGRSGRIPTAAVIGAAGAARTAHHVHRRWIAAGVESGLCTTDGVSVGDDLISAGDVTGLRGVRALLIDPGVQAAVLELPVPALHRDGHPCDGYDVVAVLHNEGVAEAEAVQRARDAVVLNADDPGCLPLRRLTTRRVILVSGDAGHPAVVEHRSGGGDAVVTDRQGRVIAATGALETVLSARSCAPDEVYALAICWAQGLAP